MKFNYWSTMMHNPAAKKEIDGNASITSFSSTFMIEEDKTTIPQAASKSGRQVWFNEARNRFFLDSSKTQEDVVNSWFRESDYNRFETKARKVATKVMTCKNKKSFVKAMEMIHEIATNKKTMSRSQQIEAVMAIRNNLQCLGLEYHAVSVMTKDARARREFLQDVVADFQQDEDLGCGWDTSDDLKSSCETITRAPMLFAHLLAKAQQFA